MHHRTSPKFLSSPEATIEQLKQQITTLQAQLASPIELYVDTSTYVASGLSFVNFSQWRWFYQYEYTPITNVLYDVSPNSWIESTQEVLFALAAVACNPTEEDYEYTRAQYRLFYGTWNMLAAAWVEIIDSIDHEGQWMCYCLVRSETPSFKMLGYNQTLAQAFHNVAHAEIVTNTPFPHINFTPPFDKVVSLESAFKSNIIFSEPVTSEPFGRYNVAYFTPPEFTNHNIHFKDVPTRWVSYTQLITHAESTQKDQDEP